MQTDEQVSWRDISCSWIAQEEKTDGQYSLWRNCEDSVSRQISGRHRKVTTRV
jgi:hypothetical protein